MRSIGVWPSRSRGRFDAHGLRHLDGRTHHSVSTPSAKSAPGRVARLQVLAVWIDERSGAGIVALQVFQREEFLGAPRRAPARAVRRRCGRGRRSVREKFIRSTEMSGGDAHAWPPPVVLRPIRSEADLHEHLHAVLRVITSLTDVAERRGDRGHPGAGHEFTRCPSRSV